MSGETLKLDDANKLIDQQARKLVAKAGVLNPDKLCLAMARMIVVEGLRQIAALPTKKREQVMDAINRGLPLEHVREFV